MEGVTQMAKPLLWPARSHPRASYMSAGASWPRRRRRAGASGAGGRASQSRRPTPPPNRTPGPKRSRPGGVGWGERRRPPPPPPLLPPPAASSPGSSVGAFPARALHAPAGRGRQNRGVPPGYAGMRGGGGRARTECGKGSAMGPAPSGAARPRSRGSQRRRRDARVWAGGMEIGTGEINTLKSPKSGRAARGREQDKPQRGCSHHVSLK